MAGNTHCTTRSASRVKECTVSCKCNGLPPSSVENDIEIPSMTTNSTTIFQCESCQSTISDSSSYVGIVEELGILVLAPNDSPLTLRISSSTSKNVIPGLSGVARKVFCAKCSQEVGAVYVRDLPPALSHLKDCFCLLSDNITSHKAPAQALPSSNDHNLLLTLNYAINEIAKMKHVMLHIDKRLTAIEKSLENEPP